MSILEEILEEGNWNEVRNLKKKVEKLEKEIALIKRVLKLDPNYDKHMAELYNECCDPNS